MLGCGLAVLLGASILEGPGDSRLAVHMVQHVMLLTAAPPLLILGLTTAAARPAAAIAGRLWGARRRRWGAWLAATATVQAVVMLGWHAPVLFGSTLRSPASHALEHACFFGSAMLFWWAVVGAGRRWGFGAASLAVYAAALPGTLLGIGMTLSRTPWYPGYVHGSPAAAVRDQQLAGAVMWGFGGLASVAASVALFVAWLVAAERSAPVPSAAG